MIQKPAVREFIVTQVSFLDEPKPMPIVEEIQHEVLSKTVPSVEKKAEKKVQKEPAKIVTIQKQMHEPRLSSAPSNDSLVEQTGEVPKSAQTEKKASSNASRQSDDRLSLYLSNVRQKIQESLLYPSMAKKMGIEGETIVQFLIHTNGMVDASSIKVAKSSGKAILDRKAIDAVMDATPFEVPPKEALEIAIPVVFKLKS